MSDQAVVPASYVRLSTLADGTVRVVIDVEPRDRAEAFEIFTEPGVPLAVARLSNIAALAADQTDAGFRTCPRCWTEPECRSNERCYRGEDDQIDAAESAPPPGGPCPAASQEAAGARMASSPAASTFSLCDHCTDTEPCLKAGRCILFGKPKRKRALAEHVAFVCEEQSFREYLRTLHPSAVGLMTPHWATVLVRRHCNVRSRKAIVEGTQAGEDWRDLEAGYHQWQRDRNVRVLYA